MKFALGDSVWIKSYSREGIIVRYFAEGSNIYSPNIGVQYEIMYYEFVGKRSEFVVVLEDDLKLFKDHISDKSLEELTNLMFAISQVSAFPSCDSYTYKATSVNLNMDGKGFKEIVLKLPCFHQWETYDSGWSKYEFCSQCNEKRQN